MFEQLEIVRMAQAMAAHAGARQGVIARNIANADTPNYRSQDLPDFADVYAGANGLPMKATRAGHLDKAQAADLAEPRIVAGAASPNGNAVSLEAEMVRAAEVRGQHDMALSIYRASADILRSALGKMR